MIELWSSNHDAYSHRCRLVVREKEEGLDKSIGVEIRDIDLNNKPDELARINPLNQVPVLVDRDLHLYQSAVICEYLDERFPHPQLMPAGVADKARARLLIHEFDRDLYSQMDKMRASKARADKHRALLAEALLLMSKRVGNSRFLAGNDITMVDLFIAPLLWRLEMLDIKLPPHAAPLLKYAETVFERPSFIASLTPAEKEMRR